MKTISHTKNFEMPVPVADLFPLFSPEGETYWVPGWDYENVMGTTELSEDYVFLTKAHDHATSDALWIIKKYEPDSHMVQFYKIEAREKMGVVTVKCSKKGSDSTQVQVTYKYMALSEAGDAFIEAFNENAYEAFIAEWQQLLSNYFDSSNLRQ